MLIPSSNPVASESDSDTKAALKRLFLTLIFALALDCRVAILHDRDHLDGLVMDEDGLAYVPPLPSLRQLVGTAWIPVTGAPKWLRALASAFILAPRANFPARNDLYTILTLPAVGALMRRIEQQAGGRLFPADLQHLENLKEVL